ncbi:MAG: hypothetical protein COB77_00085 [Gammaproteobacteria bacterium]|nr:MAG: hypothetical protein COB77_00085 [Gammaproteobacteria bacterium]
MYIKQSGFTLMEMIGVMAIIAILASAATPKIFDAIEDGKVTAYLAEANSLKLAAANYYKDTGLWPRHIPTNTNPRYHNLIVNDANGNGAKINGWSGPYIEQEIRNHIREGGYQDLLVTADKNWACDIDGNGKRDGKFLVYRADGISDEIAKKISNIVDKDGDITSGKKSWKKAGKVKRYGVKGDHGSILLYCLSQV